MTKKMLAVAAFAAVAVLAGCGNHNEEVLTGDVTTGTELVEVMTGEVVAEEVLTGEVVVEEVLTGEAVEVVAEEVVTGDVVVETIE